MKSRDSWDIFSVIRLRKRYTKQAKFSLNSNTALPGKGHIKINVPKKVTTEVKLLFKLLHRGCSD